MKRFTLCMLSVLLLGLTTGTVDAAEKDGFKSLFDGKTLTGWDGNPKFWKVEDGAITGQTTKENVTKGNTFIIWKKGTLKDFELHLSYKIINGNSGIQYRSKDHGKWVVGGYQADFEAGNTYSGILYEERGRGVLALRGQKVEIDPKGKKEVVGSLGKTKELQASIKKEEWNKYAIVARGNHVTHTINGKTMIDVTDHQDSRRAKSGILALQLHQGPAMKVQFKNIRLKVYKE